MNIAYILGVVFALAYCVVVYRQGMKIKADKMPIEAAPVYA